MAPKTRSRGKRDRERRPRRSWWGTGLLAIGTLALASAAGFQAFTALAQKRNPALVLGLQPGNAVANARFSTLAMATLTPESDFDTLIGSTARRSFVSQGLNPPAIRQLALLALLNEDEAQARRLFALSERFSHRDLATSVYQYEIAQRLGRIDEAARNLDSALRTSARGREHLLGPAVKALDDSRWRRAVAEKLRARPDWAADFWNVAINSKERVLETALLRLALPADDRTASENVTRVIIRNLLRDGHTETAVRLFRGLEADAARRMAANLDFRRGKWPPFTWETTVGVDALAAPRDDGSRLDFSVLPDASQNLLARRLIAFPPGSYTIAANVSAENEFPHDLVSLVVTCAAGNRVLARLDLGSASARGAVTAPVLIPESCPRQWLRLESAANPGNAVYGGALSPPVLRPRPMNGS